VGKHVVGSVDNLPVSMVDCSVNKGANACVSRDDRSCLCQQLQGSAFKCNWVDIWVRDWDSRELVVQVDVPGICPPARAPPHPWLSWCCDPMQEVQPSSVNWDLTLISFSCHWCNLHPLVGVQLPFPFLWQSSCRFLFSKDLLIQYPAFIDNHGAGWWVEGEI